MLVAGDVDWNGVARWKPRLRGLGVPVSSFEPLLAFLFPTRFVCLCFCASCVLTKCRWILNVGKLDFCTSWPLIMPLTEFAHFFVINCAPCFCLSLKNDMLSSTARIVVLANQESLYAAGFTMRPVVSNVMIGTSCFIICLQVCWSC